MMSRLISKKKEIGNDRLVNIPFVGPDGKARIGIQFLVSYPNPESFDAAMEKNKLDKKRLAYFENTLRHITRKLYMRNHRTGDLWEALIRICSEAKKENLFAHINDESLMIAKLIAKR